MKSDASLEPTIAKEKGEDVGPHQKPKISVNTKLGDEKDDKKNAEKRIVYVASESEALLSDSV